MRLSERIAKGIGIDESLMSLLLHPAIIYTQNIIFRRKMDAIV